MKDVKIRWMNNKITSIIIEGFQLLKDDLSADTFAIPAELLRGVFVRQIPNDISLVLRKFDAQEQVYTPYPADIHISTKGTHRAEINFTESGQQSQSFLDTLHRHMAFGYNSIPIQELPDQRREPFLQEVASQPDAAAGVGKVRLGPPPLEHRTHILKQVRLLPGPNLGMCRQQPLKESRPASRAAHKKYQVRPCHGVAHAFQPGRYRTIPCPRGWFQFPMYSGTQPVLLPKWSICSRVV